MAVPVTGLSNLVNMCRVDDLNWYTAEPLNTDTPLIRAIPFVPSLWCSH